MLNNCRVVTILLMLVMSSFAVAQQQAEQSDDKVDPQTQNETQAPQQDRGRQSNEDPDFDPTEEIIEDFSVPFPVDI